jgi:hypothetical protein
VLINASGQWIKDFPIVLWFLGSYYRYLKVNEMARSVEYALVNERQWLFAELLCPGLHSSWELAEWFKFILTWLLHSTGANQCFPGNSRWRTRDWRVRTIRYNGGRRQGLDHNSDPYGIWSPFRDGSGTHKEATWQWALESEPVRQRVGKRLGTRGPFRWQRKGVVNCNKSIDFVITR